MGRMVTLADDNKSLPLNNISTNNFSLNSTSLNNSGPPAWILNLRDIELDPPKLIRGNMEVEQKSTKYTETKSNTQTETRK